MTSVFKDVIFCQYYAFCAGRLGTDRTDEVIKNVCNHKELWLARFAGNERDSHRDRGEDEQLMEMFYQFEQKYFYPEFRILKRAQRFLLHGFSIQDDEVEWDVQVLLTLHLSGVATLLFYIAPFYETCSAGELKELTVFYKQRKRIHYSGGLRAAFAKRSIDTVPRASLDGMFIQYLLLLCDDERHEVLLRSNQVQSDEDDDAIRINQSLVNRYQFITIDGVPKEIENITSFVEQNQEALVDVAMAYRDYAREFSFSRSRSEDELDRIVKKKASVRKHLTYFMNPDRLLAVSAIKAHPDVYPYKDSPWYTSYLGMIELVLSQFEVLYLLHGDLWNRLRPERENIIKLREQAYAALMEYHNARILDHPRGRHFMEKLSQTMSIGSYYDVVKSRLDLALDIATDRHLEEEREQEKRVEEQNHERLERERKREKRERATHEEIERGNRANNLALLIITLLVSFQPVLEISKWLFGPWVRWRAILLWIGASLLVMFGREYFKRKEKKVSDHLVDDTTA